ncbi:MAG: hypothetical protein Q6L68_00255 [Thermostichus sp. DG02_5_bins_236]
MQHLLIPSSRQITAADLSPRSRRQKLAHLARTVLKVPVAQLAPSEDPKIWRRRDPSGSWVWEIRYG